MSDARARSSLGDDRHDQALTERRGFRPWAEIGHGDDVIELGEIGKGGALDDAQRSRSNAFDTRRRSRTSGSATANEHRAYQRSENVSRPLPSQWPRRGGHRRRTSDWSRLRRSAVGSARTRLHRRPQSLGCRGRAVSDGGQGLQDRLHRNGRDEFGASRRRRSAGARG